MRTMPYRLGSSVEVISVAEAQRMHRMISTETVEATSMLGRYEADAEEMSESEEEEEEELP